MARIAGNGAATGHFGRSGRFGTLLASLAHEDIRSRTLSGTGGESLIVPVLTLLLASSAATASEELRFGVDVARKGLWLEARFRFERAVQLDPDNASALNNLGIALEQQGEFEKAREAYERALQLKPKNTYIQQNYDLFRESDEKRNRKKAKKP